VEGQRCIASAICPARTTSSPRRSAPRSSHSTLPSPATPLSPTTTSKRHSSSIQGTIGQGEAGIPTALPQDELSAPAHLNEKEREIFNKLKAALEPTKLEVQDISGGCGSMYGIEVVSERFRGLGMLRQQRLVNEILGKEMIAEWHGVQLRTSAP
jgi:stress-induced morphogen